ncbi:transcriptional repressor TraM [Brucella cytisi]|uniref:Transcriptional repressor TraM n=1 Tax=Brucella cytisi TaxID=407152 RepID=A0A1J6HMH2_9HYPH|nr:transcriptional repressor TraM [Brucella cytisi]OIS94189.1 hypothetical protein BLA27_06595 [Brucella cytisi]
MRSENDTDLATVIRPLIGLTQDLRLATLENIVIDAIRHHRDLVNKSDALFQSLPEECRSGQTTDNPEYVEYIKSAIDMHTHMSGLTTLLGVLGYVPDVN